MISLTRLNAQPILLNPLQFEHIDQVPDTQVTMMNGHRYFVVETPQQIQALIGDWLRGNLRALMEGE